MIADRKLFFLVSLFFFIFIYCSHHTFGESHDPALGGPIVRRLAPGEELTDRKIGVLSKVFHLDATFIKERYSERFTSAVGEASRDNMVPMAAIFAELFGTLNDQQFSALNAAVKAENDAELAKTPRDTKFIAFLGYLQTAAGYITDPKSPPQEKEPSNFFGAFAGEFGKIKEANLKFKDQLQQAVGGIPAAKAFLKNQYDPRALLSFVDSQRKSGNEELARNITKSLSEAETSGNHSIDMVGPQGQKERLTFGNSDANIDLALKRFGGEQGFGSRSFSTQRHTTVDKTFSYSGSGESPVTDKKTAVAVTIKPSLPSTPLSVDKKLEKPTVSNSPATQAALGVLKENCLSCHGPGQRKENVFALNADGSPNLKDNTLTEAVDRILTHTLVDEDMPPKKALSATQKATLKGWAKEQNIAIPK